VSVDLLAGVRVLDFSIWRPGPYATSLLADLGAGVLKIEPPGGDPMREFPDLFGMLNADKRSIMLDLKDDDDAARALELAAVADVVVEGFRPGVAGRLGIGYGEVRSINPSVVYCSISGYGQSGPLADAPGHDLNYQALAGALIPRDGSAPVHPGLPYGDLAGGVFGALSICAALIRQPRGTYIDVSMADALASWTGPFPRTRVAGVSGSIRGGVPSYGIFECADGERITIAVVSEDHFWRNLCDVLELPDIRELSTTERIMRAGEIRARLAAAMAAQRRDDLVERLLAADVPVAPVLTPEEMLGHPHFLARGTVIETAWGAPAVVLPTRFAGRRGAPLRPAPALDEHKGQAFEMDG
jgi:crotonobetainyl-CoA:carnitine CoA-transferase CaiB-like acyl-CoA transferase